jgi:hypothetical protein
LDKFPATYKALEGKTYTLFGKSDDTALYYQKIRHLADMVLEKCGDIEFVINTIQAKSGKKRQLEKISAKEENSTLISFMLHLLNNSLSEYTEKVDEHLKSVSIKELWDRRLGTTRLQYHLYMLEIELTNRLYSSAFRNTDYKIALLPHCIRDFKTECKAIRSGFDYQCKHCSKNCYQNHISRILKENNINAFIWMGGDFKRKSKSVAKSGQTLGMMGIACIPELTMGMRKCRKYNIPVIGLPLDANRCVRWMGSFYENSVNLEILEKLIK